MTKSYNQIPNKIQIKLHRRVKTKKTNKKKIPNKQCTNTGTNKGFIWFFMK